MSGYEDQLADAADQLVKKLSKQQLILSTAESCTGGLIGKVITDVAGSSAVYDRGYITYANDAKIEMLGVEHSQLIQHGAVSEEIARAMANGAIKNSGSQVAVSTTGIAGPGGGTDEKPVGTVCFAWQLNDQLESSTQYFEGDRSEIRFQASIYVIQKLYNLLN